MKISFGSQRFTQRREAAPTFFDNGERLVFASKFDVAQQFGQASKTGETRVSSTRADGQRAAFDDDDAQVFVQIFEVQRGVQPDDSAADDGDINVFEKTFALPIREVVGEIGHVFFKKRRR